MASSSLNCIYPTARVGYDINDHILSRLARNFHFADVQKRLSHGLRAALGGGFDRPIPAGRRVYPLCLKRISTKSFGWRETSATHSPNPPCPFTALTHSERNSRLVCCC